MNTCRTCRFWGVREFQGDTDEWRLCEFMRGRPFPAEPGDTDVPMRTSASSSCGLYQPEESLAHEDVRKAIAAGRVHSCEEVPAPDGSPTLLVVAINPAQAVQFRLEPHRTLILEAWRRWLAGKTKPPTDG